MAANWSELHSELVELILKRLGLVEKVQFKAVCSSWNVAMQSYTSSPTYIPLPQIPWLLFPNYPQPQQGHHYHEQYYCHMSLINVEDNKLYNIKNLFKGFSKVLCLGTSYTWLMILEKEANPHLVNPFSPQLKIQLPSIETLFMSCSSSLLLLKQLLRKMYISKAILVPDSFRNKSYSVVVIIFGLKRRLAFCKLGDSTWSQFGNDICYDDIICCNSMLYVFHSTTLVEVWDIRSDFPKKVLDLELYTIIVEVKREFSYLPRPKINFVESMGELFAVLHIIGEDDGEIGFGIYKLDYGGGNWVRMEDLRGGALFISENGSMLVTVGDFLKGREDFIYFTVREKDLDDEYYYNIKVYNFKDKILVDKTDGDEYRRIVWPPLWIVPNLW
ncbi:hypothetical protein FEM48_Zijuj07G0079400 [Ziziphus jujuba var. spinosa]|uniref:F-box domain-containing protein n=1 Tax=Ziziphus jujuba var. spinosa TaxID=714518 RepID=A0A978V3F2_ZIZJJ|nr:hypothetical protein FEM48_Zijuj07G0079400 [Ziziphus jujuba var. spinosa]